MPTENDNISAILQKLPVFTGLTADEYNHIQKICLPARFDDGETLFVEGENSPCMYVLLSGDVQLRTHNQGPIHALNPGELFGEIGFISQQNRTATAIARAPTLLLQINYEVFQNLVLREPRISFTIMRNIIMNLSNHIARMNEGDVIDLSYFHK